MAISIAGIIDVVGRKEQDIICVELKTSLNRKVYYQAYGNNLITYKSYAAVSSLPKQKNIDAFDFAGLGILRIQDNSVSIILHPRDTDSVNAPTVEMMHKRLDLYTEGGIAGFPNMKGNGPAQECNRKIIEYKEKYPSATWKEIFEKVPNHYRSYRSLQSSMSAVKMRQA